MSTQKFSLVVPTMNEEKYLLPCLESAKAQSVPPDEMIALDASSDGTPALCESYGWSVVKQQSKGVSGARKEGVEAAQYEIIANTDADTKLDKHWVREVKKAFQDPEVVCVFGPVYLLDGPLWLRLLSGIGYTLFLWWGVATKSPT